MKASLPNTVTARRLMLVLACSLLALASVGFGLQALITRSHRLQQGDEQRSQDGIMSLRTRIRLSENDTRKDAQPVASAFDPSLSGLRLALRD